MFFFGKILIDGLRFFNLDSADDLEVLLDALMLAHIAIVVGRRLLLVDDLLHDFLNYFLTYRSQPQLFNLLLQ